MNMLDAARIRKDFPIFKYSKLGHHPFIYLDSAATTQRPRAVIDAVTSFYSERNSNVHRGLYAIAEEATLGYEEVRRHVKSFINSSDEREIIFTKNTTEAANMVMRGWGEKNIRKGDRIVTTIMEHHSNFVPWQQLARMRGAKLDVIGIDDEGLLDMNELEKKAKGARLIAFSAASNVIGTLADTRRICAIAEVNGAISVVDGAQSVPSHPTDVKRMGCDFLMFSGHKMLAPFGVGVLYGTEEVLEKMDPFMFGSEMIRSVSMEKSEWNELPYRFEPGTPDVAAVMGFGAAMDYIERIGIDEIQKHEAALISYLLERLKEVRGLEVLGPAKPENRGPLVAFTLEGIHPHDVAALLAEDGICVRSGHHCAMPLHERLGIPASTRASVYIYNRKDEVDALVGSLERAKKVFSQQQ
jgi:cysteine desulfurase/selenocysteine lyase